MPKITQKLVNRGGFGLLNKVQPDKLSAVASLFDPRREDDLPALFATAPRDRMLPEFEQFSVDVGSVVYDPMNARLHPERNIEAIKESLCRHGQRTLLVVNSRTRHVEKGNGTLQSARELGWTRIAAVFVDDGDVEAAAYGLADNRSADHARYDVETVRRLERLISDGGGGMVGFSTEELAVLRVGDFTAPPDDFQEVGEDIDTQHRCPRCGYRFSGVTVRPGEEDAGLKTVPELEAELEALRRINESLAARCAGQSDQLTLLAAKNGVIP